jgi:hypothetical protein
VAEIEACWLEQERHNDPKEAPLLCFECPRFKTLKFFNKPEPREAQIFLNGFRFALLQLAIQLNKFQPLSKEQHKYIQGMEIQTKCSLDRGVSVVALEQCVQEMINSTEISLSQNKKPDDH